MNDVWVYHARLADLAGESMASLQNSSHARLNVSALLPFELVPHPIVHYIEFQPPAGQWPVLSKATLYTDCMQRARHSHAFVLASDPDEVFFPMERELPLGAFLDSIWPASTASLAFHNVLYPLPCQHVQVNEPGVSLMHDTHWYMPNPMLGPAFQQPKSIGRPALVSTWMIHTIGEAESGVDCPSQAVSPAKAFFKHVRSFPVCRRAFKDHLADDSDHAELMRVMDDPQTWDMSKG